MTDRFCDTGRGVALCYRTYGAAEGEPLLLIAGLGLDLTSWSDGFVGGLVAAGFRVIAFDNRDAGASTHLDTRPPGLLRKVAGRARPDAYDLDDMAADTVALLNHLQIGRVHLVGMSMGGMIAQVIAATYPDRVASLTSIFSTTGDRRVGQPALSTMVRIALPPATTEERYIASHLSLLDHIGSVSQPYDPVRERECARRSWTRGPGRSWHRSRDRQISAIYKSGDRTAALGRIVAPTLVVHGEVDKMVAPSGGRATARAIPGARHVTVPGLAHHLPASLDAQLVGLITEHTSVARGAPAV